MLLIRCPWCGPRAQTEFTYGGDATVSRPDPDNATTKEWLDSIYIRENPRGAHIEWWHHTAGCRRWLKVARNTLTHEVYDSTPPDGAPEIDAS